MVRTWYFINYTNFTTAEGQLLEYLKKSGKTDTKWLNLSMSRPDGSLNYTCEDAANISSLGTQCYGSNLKQFPVTAFSDNTTAGYFFAIEDPTNSSRSDYFIEYWGVFSYDGVISTSDLSKHLKTLNQFMELMGDSWAFHLPHEIQGNPPAGLQTFNG